MLAASSQFFGSASHCQTQTNSSTMAYIAPKCNCYFLPCLKYQFLALGTVGKKSFVMTTGCCFVGLVNLQLPVSSGICITLKPCWWSFKQAPSGYKDKRQWIVYAWASIGNWLCSCQRLSLSQSCVWAKAVFLRKQAITQSHKAVQSVNVSSVFLAFVCHCGEDNHLKSLRSCGYMIYVYGGRC